MAGASASPDLETRGLHGMALMSWDREEQSLLTLTAVAGPRAKRGRGVGPSDACAPRGSLEHVGGREPLGIDFVGLAPELEAPSQGASHSSRAASKNRQLPTWTLRLLSSLSSLRHAPVIWSPCVQNACCTPGAVLAAHPRSCACVDLRGCAPPCLPASATRLARCPGCRAVCSESALYSLKTP